MGRRPTPLPTALGDVFTTAQARRAGVSASRLARLPAPFHGVRCRRAPSTLLEHAQAAALALPDGAVIAGTTAAHLHDLWLPRSWRAGEPIEAVVPTTTTRPRLAGVRCGRRDVVGIERHGLSVAPPPDVFAQLATRLRRADLVVLADSIVRRGSAYDVADLAAALARGRRGTARGRHALTLTRPGSASAQETWTRLWVVDAGLPEPQLNARIELHDRIVYGDLTWPDERVCVEYHGAYHFASDATRFADFERTAALRREGWTVLEIGRGTLTDSRRRNRFLDDLASALGVRARPHATRGRTLRDPMKSRARRPRSQKSREKRPRDAE